MKISAAALLFLILAAALGPPTHGSPVQAFSMKIQETNPSLMGHGGVHHPSDCCLSYTSRNIRCVFMEDYYETSSGCSKSAVIFKTKRGHHVCTNPSSNAVQECMTKLVTENLLEKLLQ